MGYTGYTAFFAKRWDLGGPTSLKTSQFALGLIGFTLFGVGEQYTINLGKVESSAPKPAKAHNIEARFA